MQFGRLRDSMRGGMRVVLGNPWLPLALRLILGGIFLAASIAKLSNQAEFVSAVMSYGILPDSLARLYGSVVPWVELAIGLCLVLGLFTRVASGLAVPLTLSFIIANAYGISRQFGDDCGCFGALVPMSYPVSLTLDVLMLLIAVLLLCSKHTASLSIGALLPGTGLRSIGKVGPVLHMAGEFALVGIIVLAIGIPLHGGATQSAVYARIDESLEDGKPVFVYFYIEGCGECEEQKPVIHRLEELYGDGVTFVQVDYKKEADFALDFDIHGAPAMILIAGKNEEGYGEVGRFFGYTSQAVLQEAIEQLPKQ